MWWANNYTNTFFFKTKDTEEETRILTYLTYSSGIKADLMALRLLVKSHFTAGLKVSALSAPACLILLSSAELSCCPLLNCLVVLC